MNKYFSYYYSEIPIASITLFCYIGFMQLSILYQDNDLIAINKPSGLLVHRSPIDKHETQFAVQLLRDQIGQMVYPIHRLDKPTSGVLLFAFNTDIIRQLSLQWHQVDKTYLAIVRGRVTDCFIDHPITTKPDKGDHFTQAKVQSAQTGIRVLATTTLDIGFGKLAHQYPTTDFSLLSVTPKTGRKHQIRKHLKHINHPIVGDTRYGRGEINRYFRETYDCNRLLLHCQTMTFLHPISGQWLSVSADVSWNQQIKNLFIT